LGSDEANAPRVQAEMAAVDELVGSKWSAAGPFRATRLTPSFGVGGEWSEAGHLSPGIAYS
jgi:hypothetical protein